MIKRSLLAIIICIYGIFLYSEDGSKLWLRQMKVCNALVECQIKSPTLDIACAELSSQWKGGKVILQIMADEEHYRLGKDGYTIQTINNTTILGSISEIGLLYATYHLLRLQMTSEKYTDLNIKETPVYEFRILNHWDNLNGTIERGYAGNSLWKWDELPEVTSKRYEEYARANASIGINGAVLNNVNASAKILSTEYLNKVKTLADIFRKYGIKVYLAVNFACPMILGELSTADPMNKEVYLWWKEKVSDIYRLIPDFGGFLVKANSEGQPGPCDYNRTHAEGANMLATALKPYNGIVMWRAFVYSPTKEDRAKQAYLEFKPLDGKFLIVQVKNGPIDFQPREPVV